MHIFQFYSYSTFIIETNIRFDYGSKNLTTFVDGVSSVREAFDELIHENINILLNID